MTDDRPVFVWHQPARNTYETIWTAKRLMIRKDAPKVWTCWVEYSNTKRGSNPIARSTCTTLKAAQRWCADIVMLNQPIHKTRRFKS